MEEGQPSNEEGQTSSTRLKNASGEDPPTNSMEVDSTPAEAPTKDFPVDVHQHNDVGDGSKPTDVLSSNAEKLKSSPKKRSPSKKANKKRKMRSAAIEEAEKEPSGLTLPSTQYETTLIRRAIRKNDTLVTVSPALKQPTTANKEVENLEVYGDTSLGMKLSVVGGKVIVQHLNPLLDGRASPAQLAGVVKRGDVLLLVNNRSLVHLPIDQLMNRLGPLSKPESATGAYQRKLHLRFASGEGLDLLSKSEESSLKPLDSSGSGDGRGAVDAANDMFSLFPMVDQLSGAPYDLPIMEAAKENRPPKEVETKPLQEAIETEASLLNKTATLNEMISGALETERDQDRGKFSSEYFNLNESVSEILRHPRPNETLEQSSLDDTLSLPELIELGQRAIIGAKALSDKVEKVDNGKDVRSFKAWSSTLSLHSRASARRRAVFDAASLPMRFDRVEEEDSDDDSEHAGSVEGENSDDEEQLDGDEVLLRLAAHDEIWRQQVLDFLDNSIQEMEGNEEKDSSEKTPASPGEEDDLGQLLFGFGDNMTKILSKNKKPQALPPKDITTELFDLTTKISTSVPDNITALGSQSISARSSLVPFSVLKRPRAGSDVLLANRFLLDDALPLWLKTFRALPWEQRRVLWPLEKSQSGGSTAASSFSDDLTLDSIGTSQTTVKQRKRNLRERIEDQELEIESRGETCFLVTYFFTQYLLPKRNRHTETTTDAGDAIPEFVEVYGAYLKMQTCLSYAAAIHADHVVDSLLAVAKHDPRHKEVMKQMARTNSMIFYEPTMLSAVVQRLHEIQLESAKDRKVAIIDMCASAFPDVRPWQVKKECCGDGVGRTSADMSHLYYSYLSLLLHPLDGHDAAQRDRDLVKEWCVLSIEKGGSTDARNNYFAVASRASSDHRVYNRDLVFLMKLSMQIEDRDLGLDLAGEILEDDLLARDQEVLDFVLLNVRAIAKHTRLNGGLNHRTMTRVLRLLKKGATSESEAARSTFDIPRELLHMLNLQRKKISSTVDREVVAFLNFLREEANPLDLLEALSLWSRTNCLLDDTFPVVHVLLRRGANASRSTELSTSLLRLRRARVRRRLVEAADQNGVNKDVDNVDGQTIWKSMSHGMVTVAK